MAEIYVTSTADSGAGTLRQAIADAQDGDVILFDPTVFPGGVIPPTVIEISSQIAINKSITIDGDGRVSIDGQNIVRCFYVATAGVEVALSKLWIMNGSAQGGGGVYVSSSAKATISECNIMSCSSSSHGAGVFARDTAQATIENCSLTNNTASNNGGGVYVRDSAQATLINCNMQGNGAATGQALYSTQTAAVVVSDCSLTLGAGSVVFSGSGSASVIDSRLQDVDFGASVTTTIDGATVIDNFYARSGSTVTLADGAGLAITSAATVTGATITSAGRSYLALADDVDVSAATVANSVIQCEYGAGLTAFDATITGDAASATWTQADSTKTILLEADSGSGYATLTQSAAGSYTFTTPSPTTYKFLAFDGERFFRKTVTRTYYYIGGAEGSFTSASDWSLTSGGAAISAAPTVKDCKFIIE